MGTTAVSALGGFGFWIVVTRYYPATEVGHATAMVSAITFLSQIGVFGLGTMLIGQLALHPARVDPLLPAALEVSAVLSGVLSALFAIVVACMPNTGLHQAFGSHWSTYIWFIVGVAVSSSSLVFDLAALGIGAGHIQWLRNTVVSAARLPAVIAIAICWGRTADSVLISWASTVILSFVVIAWPMRRRGMRFMRFRSPRSLRGLVMHTTHHNTLYMSLTVPRSIMPIIVAAFAAGTTTAVFYVCWMIVSFLYLVPSHLSTALFAVAAGDADTLRKKLRPSLSISLVTGCIVVPLLALLAYPVLSMFGPEYAKLGAATLAILAFLYFPNAIKQHFAAILRVRGNVRFAGAVCMAGAVAEVAAFVIALKFGGIQLASGVLCIVLFVEGILMSPTVVRAIRPASPPVGHTSTPAAGDAGDASKANVSK
jgi:O-antigen/teichoic acid export membrane protein